MSKVYVIHGNREYRNETDREHISFYTLSVMRYIVELSLGEGSQIELVRVDNGDGVAQCSKDDSVIMFVSGDKVLPWARELAESCGNLSVILEDLNWRCDLSWLTRPFRLVTWSVTLEQSRRDLTPGAYRDIALSAINAYAPNWMLPSRELVAEIVNISLIDMILKCETDSYLRSVSPVAHLSAAMSHAYSVWEPARCVSRLVYAGSSKPERLREVFKTAADHHWELDLYGNIQARECSEYEQPSKVSYHGRVPFHQVARRLMSHDRSAVAYSLDPAIAHFRFETLRKLETAVAMRPVYGVLTGDSATDCVIDADTDRIRFVQALMSVSQTPEILLESLVDPCMRGSHTEEMVLRMVRRLT